MGLDRCQSIRIVSPSRSDMNIMNGPSLHVHDIKGAIVWLNRCIIVTLILTLLIYRQIVLVSHFSIVDDLLCFVEISICISASVFDRYWSSLSLRALGPIVSGPVEDVGLGHHAYLWLLHSSYIVFHHFEILFFELLFIWCIKRRADIFSLLEFHLALWSFWYLF